MTRIHFYASKSEHTSIYCPFLDSKIPLYSKKCQFVKRELNCKSLSWT